HEGEHGHQPRPDPDPSHPHPFHLAVEIVPVPSVTKTVHGHRSGVGPAPHVVLPPAWSHRTARTCPSPPRTRAETRGGGQTLTPGGSEGGGTTRTTRRGNTRTDVVQLTGSPFASRPQVRTVYEPGANAWRTNAGAPLPSPKDT